MFKRTFLSLLFLSSLLLSNEHRTIALEKLFKTNLNVKGKLYQTFLAIDPKQKQEGLSNLESSEFSSAEAMLFIYPYNEKLFFWMKDTHIDLDIAYIDAKGIVSDIFTMKRMRRKAFPSTQKVRYALEVRAGEFKKLGLKVGEKILFPSIILELSKP